MEDVHHRQPDGTMIYGKRWSKGRPSTCVLIIPDIGETLLHGYYDAFAERFLENNMVVYVLEHRGHRLSEGEWSLHAYRADITYWISHFRNTHKNFYVVADGFSASTMLEYDTQAHRFPSRLPPLPDGMVLIDPVFSGVDVLPEHGTGHKIARTLMGKRAVEKKLSKLGVRFQDPALYWQEMEHYELEPVRVQTPTTLFISGDELADPLKRVFGTVQIRRVTWLSHHTHAELAKHAREVSDALAHVRAEGRPHRFRVKR